MTEKSKKHKQFNVNRHTLKVRIQRDLDSAKRLLCRNKAKITIKWASPQKFQYENRKLPATVFRFFMINPKLMRKIKLIIVIVS